MITVPQRKLTQEKQITIHDLPNLATKVSKETCHQSDQSSSWASVESVEIQLLKDSFDNSKCFFGNEGMTLCFNPKCQKNAIICINKGCGCKKNHKNCSHTFFDGFLDFYDHKLKEKKTTVKKIETVFQKLIDKISQMEQELIKTVERTFFSDQQSKFIQKIRNQDFSSLRGKQITETFSFINKENQIENQNKIFDQLTKEIENLANQTLGSFKKMNESILKEKLSKIEEKQGNQEEIKIIFEKQTSDQIDSLIITEKQELQTMKSFFDNRSKTIKRIELLYRASQNKFSIEKFYDTCSNIPDTIILMKTEFGKIIGGYTPLIWKKYLNVSKRCLEDQSLQSFIFSVTEKEKLQLAQKENATYYLSYAPGPRFGKQGCADLWICDEAHKKADSYVFGNMSYQNPKFSPDFKSYEKFIGGPTQYFKTKEWEVFKVVFE